MGISDGMSYSSILVKFCFLLILTSAVASWIAFTTSSWGVNSDTVYTGIWRRCQGQVCVMLDGYPKVWFGVFQAFAIIGFMGINVAVVTIALYMFGASCKGNRETGFVAALVCIFTALFWLIAVIIFGAKYELDDEVSGPDSLDRLGFSFGLAVAALGLELIVGILMVLEVRLKAK
ncbi:uncharacterized protein LOC131941459 [Physella acuta]|uniref:uncharacterized protein LOC131941459 n=1 Tax=Physella acuta TaxID=109671 RepID=UPI0027DCFEAC|nr:uncharacterized protein LOC131941459 [Physella acuta]